MIKLENKGIITYKNMDAFEIQKFQQNRYPLLFIDYVEEAVAGKSAKGYKNFSYNEWFFPAHFEDEPNVPGFVQMESLTQMFLMSFLTIPGHEGRKTAFIRTATEFKEKIIPGDRLDIVAELDSCKRGLAKGKSIGYLNGNMACRAELIIAIPDVMRSFRPIDNTTHIPGGVYSIEIASFKLRYQLNNYNRIQYALNAS